MTIQRQGGFLLDLEPDRPPVLGIESRRLAACITEVRRKGYTHVFAAGCWGFRERTLDFLRECPGLQSVEVWHESTELDDLSALLEQRQLVALRVAVPHRPPLDFSGFRKLRSLVLSWRKGDHGLERLRPLKDFYLWHYLPRSKSLAELALPPMRGKAELTWLNVSSLEGLRGLEGAKELRLHRCRNLVSLDGIEALGDSLEKVLVTTCGKLEDLQALQRLPRLRSAWIDAEERAPAAARPARAPARRRASAKRA